MHHRRRGRTCSCCNQHTAMSVSRGGLGPALPRKVPPSLTYPGGSANAAASRHNKDSATVPAGGRTHTRRVSATALFCSRAHHGGRAALACGGNISVPLVDTHHGVRMWPVLLLLMLEWRPLPHPPHQALLPRAKSRRHTRRPRTPPHHVRRPQATAPRSIVVPHRGPVYAGGGVRRWN